MQARSFPIPSYNRLAQPERALPPLRAIAIVMCLIFGIQAFVPIEANDALSSGLSIGRLAEPLFMMVALGMLAFSATRYDLQDALSDRGFFIVAIFSVWALVTTAWSPDLLRTSFKSIGLAATALTAALMISQARYRRLWPAGLVKAICVAIFAVLLIHVFYNYALNGEFITIGAHTTLDSVRYRLELAYVHPLAIGDIASLGVIAMLASSFRWHWKLLGTLTLASAVYATDSRAAMASLALAIMLMALNLFKDARWRLAAVFMAVVLLVAGAVAINLNVERLLPSDATTLNGRTELWAFAADSIAENWLTGVGYFASRHYLIDTFDWAGHLHNAYLEILFTTGIVGVVLVVLYSLHWINVAVRTRSNLLIGVGTYVYLMAFTGPTIFEPGYIMLILMLAVGHAELAQRLKREESLIKDAMPMMPRGRGAPRSLPQLKKMLALPAPSHRPAPPKLKSNEARPIQDAPMRESTGDSSQERP